MRTHVILVDGRSMKLGSGDGMVVRTSIGVDKVRVLFDSSEWLGFPVTATFSQRGVSPVTQQMAVSTCQDAEGYEAEGYVDVPLEVTRKVGPIRVTLQGTDSDGNHIITADAHPLAVRESGDVTMGDIPEDAPTVDEWHQAYAMAMDAVSRALDAIAALEAIGPASEGHLGMVMPDGDTIVAEEDGTIHASQYQLPTATPRVLGGVMPDGTSITVDEDGTIHGMFGYELPIASNGVLGGIMPDGVSIVVDSTGYASATLAAAVQKATADRLGIIRIGDGLSYDDDGVTSVEFFTDDEIIEMTPMDDIVNGDGIGY